jgi:hypothetical protein
MKTTEELSPCGLSAISSITNEQNNDNGRNNTLEDTFPDRIQFIQNKKIARNKEKRRLNISITSTKSTDKGDAAIQMDAPTKPIMSHITHIDSDDIWEPNDLDDFFSQTHEEQGMHIYCLMYNIQLSASHTRVLFSYVSTL